MSPGARSADPKRAVDARIRAACPCSLSRTTRSNMLLFEKLLQGSEFQVIPRADARRGEAGAQEESGRSSVLLDILLEVESGWTLLTEMKSQDSTKDVPVFVLTVGRWSGACPGLGRGGFLSQANQPGVAHEPARRGWLRTGPLKQS